MADSEYQVTDDSTPTERLDDRPTVSQLQVTDRSMGYSERDIGVADEQWDVLTCDGGRMPLEVEYLLHSHGETQADDDRVHSWKKAVLPSRSRAAIMGSR